MPPDAWGHSHSPERQKRHQATPPEFRARLSRLSLPRVIELLQVLFARFASRPIHQYARTEHQLRHRFCQLLQQTAPVARIAPQSGPRMDGDVSFFD